MKTPLIHGRAQIPLFAVVLIFASALHLDAALLFSDPGGASGTLNAPGTTVGAQFTVGNLSIEVTGLGVYDDLGNGLDSAHEVGLWTLSSTTPIASATVPTGIGGTLIGTYRYTDITPVTLSANTTYRIGALFETGTGLIGQGGTAITDSAISSADPQWYDNTSSSSLTRPNTDLGLNRWSANMEFTAVPEPQGWATLVAGSLLGFAALHRWRRS